MVTVTGIYADIRASSISTPDSRPTVLFYTNAPSEYLLVKLYQLSPDNIQKISEVLEKSMPGKDIVVTPYKSSMINLYKDARLFRNSVLIGGIVTLLIALIGLLGYTNDEINRRSAEIAIRKINGATIQNIQRLFLKDILRIALFHCIGRRDCGLCSHRMDERILQKNGIFAFIVLRLWFGCSADYSFGSKYKQF